MNEDKTQAEKDDIAVRGHPCPFQEEMNGNHENYCLCDEEQARQCAMDI
jgi:hypothetical protein